jgi:hypothetical protein
MVLHYEANMNADAITMTIPQFCRASGRSRSTIYEWIKAGLIKTVRIGGPEARQLVIVASYRDLIADAQNAGGSKIPANPTTGDPNRHGSGNPNTRGI